MNCPDFRELIAERVGGDLSAEQIKQMDAHEQSCSSCHRTLADWREMQSLLLASWPSEDPRRPFYLPNPREQAGWLGVARNWFAIASMAAVAGCLLMLAILRPSVTFDRHQVSLNFSPAHSEEGTTSAQAVTQAEVQEWVRQALEPASVGSAKGQPVSGPLVPPSSEEQFRRIAQLGVELEILKENQASLWQQVEQHGLYLQSAWRSSSAPNEKLNFNQQ